ncbi:acyltransferase family protein [Spirillospora sp. NPDC048911]|uniref:acyltransferase family protein n=1 Tax=Spirillospora sp. NPDC048911 TaxID=3364527 RepID=UPI00371A5929
MSERAAAPPGGRARDPFFDNAKFVAITLVVAGHAIGGLRDVPAARAVYVFIYMFHMPVFILLTGYLSRGFTLAGSRVRKLTLQLVVPYVFFEILFSLYFWLTTSKPLEFSLLRPTYVMWFLMAVFLWRLTTPVWKQLRWPFAIALGISLLSYMTEMPKELSLHRMFGLLPFYVLGTLLRPEHFQALRTPRAKVLGTATLLLGLLFISTVGRKLPHQWVFWDSGHEALDVSNVMGTLVRTGMFGLSMALTFAFLAVVPARRLWFTALGATTLYAYLLHDFAVRTLMIYFGWYELEWLHTPPGVALVAIAGSVLATVLCTPPVVRATRFLVEPRLNWLFAPAQPSSPAPRSAPRTAHQGSKP